MHSFLDLLMQIRNLKYLAPFSSIANVATIISFGIIWYYIFRDPLTLDERHAAGHLREFPLFFGTVSDETHQREFNVPRFIAAIPFPSQVLFALEAIGVVSCCIRSHSRKNNLMIFPNLDYATGE